MQIISFMTDFGTKDNYVSQMKAVASEITDARLIDITHEITPHNIREGAYTLRGAAPYFPTGTVHVAVIDPGVGTERRGLLITTSKHILIGPDNGILMPTAHHLGNFIVYEIQNKKYMLDSISSTFHGRDIFTPIAAHITNGVVFEEIGPKIDDFVDLDFGNGEINKSTAKTQVIYIDRFGNIITNLQKETKVTVSTAIGSYIAIVLAAFFAGIEIGIGGAIPFNIIIPIMVFWHLLIGIGEAVISALIVYFIYRAKPEFIMTEEILGVE